MSKKNLTAAQKFREEMNKMRDKLYHMKEEYGTILHAENMALLEEGLTFFKNADEYQKGDLRLLGTKDWNVQRAFGRARGNWESDQNTPVSDIVIDYETLCAKFDLAMSDIKSFYHSNKHLPMIEFLIERQKAGNSEAERALVKIFRNAKNAKNYAMR